MQKIVVLTGAGISAESGIGTFRAADGLWENHKIEDVATPLAWARDPELVLNFYKGRWAQLATVAPNAAHYALVALEKKFSVDIVTQNVDNLHERAGSANVLHLHGELTYARSTSGKDTKLYPIKDRYIQLGDKAADGSQLRPHIVWFTEAVPLLDTAIALSSDADFFIIVGTSLQVYPAASLYQCTKATCKTWAIDPGLTQNQFSGQVTLIAKNATEGVVKLVDYLLSQA